MKNPLHTASDEPLLRRIRGEFLEMPGLRLTCEQAQRLWALDPPTCAGLLQTLVEARFLQRGADGRYGRIGDSFIHHLPVRMVKADVDIDPRSHPGQHMRFTG